jgi:hypothetical protein
MYTYDSSPHQTKIKIMCMYIYIQICIFIYIYIYIYICISIYKYMYMYEYLYIYMNIYVSSLHPTRRKMMMRIKRRMRMKKRPPLKTMMTIRETDVMMYILYINVYRCVTTFIYVYTTMKLLPYYTTNLITHMHRQKNYVHQYLYLYLYAYLYEYTEIDYVNF